MMVVMVMVGDGDGEGDALLRRGACFFSAWPIVHQLAEAESS